MALGQSDPVLLVNRNGGRYAAELSNPILACIADSQEGIERHNLCDVARAAASQVRTRYELARLFSDLVCNLNGTTYLTFVAGVITGYLSTGPAQHEPLVVQHNPDAAGNEATDATDRDPAWPGRGE